MRLDEIHCFSSRSDITSLAGTVGTVRPDLHLQGMGKPIPQVNKEEQQQHFMLAMRYSKKDDPTNW